MKKPKLLLALDGRNLDGPPIWLMRQAGRFLPAYQKLRSHHSLKELFLTPQLAAQVTLMPQSLGVDALILFSDILAVCDLMDLSWDFDHHGPLVQTIDFEKKLPLLLPAKKAQSYLLPIIETIRASSDLPLIGFCGGPWTLATYLLEGRPTRDAQLAKAMLYSNPQKMKRLLQTLSEALIDSLRWQVECGAQVVQIFESFAGSLPQPLFDDIVLPFLSQIVGAMKVPVILFCRGASSSWPLLKATKATALGIDWHSSLSKAREILGPCITLQGNLDPAVLCSTQEAIGSEVDKIMAVCGRDPAFIFNLGHGVLPQTPVENVQFLISYLNSQSEVIRCF